mmetsp:Transcript_2561/g.6955  ORF Transcript_2561/g.6955 Transcript_2561/m.6955 type:complete len:254 (-) Transcript_2561:49-810(-)
MSQTDNRKRLPLQFLSAEHGLVLLDTFAGDALSSEILHVIDAIDDATTSEEHAAKHQFLHGIGIGSWRVEHRDAQFGHASHRDVVRTSSTPSNGTHGLRHVLLLQFVGAQQDGMRIGGLLVVDTDVVLVLREFGKSDGRNLVECLDLVLSHLVIFNIAVRLPLPASVLDLDIHHGANGNVASAGHDAGSVRCCRRRRREHAAVLQCGACDDHLSGICIYVQRACMDIFLCGCGCGCGYDRRSKPLQRTFVGEK